MDKITRHINLFAESAIDPTRTDLDLDIFDKIGTEYKMKEYIRAQIIDIVNEIDKEIIPVNDWFIKGSILSYQWLPWSDVDILIEIDMLGDRDWDELRAKINERFENLMVAGTRHPIQIFPQRGEYDSERADGIYNVKDNTWAKGPYDLVVDINDYMDVFIDKATSFDIALGELERDVVDYAVIQALTPEEVATISDQAKQKSDEIDKDIDLLVQKRDEIKDARWAAFDKDMDPEELKKYTSKNELPANIIQKMLERYRYFGIINILKMAKEESADKIDKPDDVEKVRRALEELPSALESLDMRLRAL